MSIEKKHSEIKTSHFGERLKAIRCSRHMSQEEMGALLGTCKQVISRYEKSDREPKITVLMEYADKLHVSVDYLLGIREVDITEQAHLVACVYMCAPTDKQRSIHRILGLDL